MRSTSLRQGLTKSCGCLVVDIQRARNTIHGMHDTPAYTCYKNMMRRCHSPSDPHYPNHGGRGIVVCDHWRGSFTNFWNDMKEGYRIDLTIERVDNNGPYSKENCIWADRVTQQNNRRNNKVLKAGDRSMTVAQWSRESGLATETIHARLRLGWSEADAVTMQPSKSKYYKRATPS